MWKRTSRGLTLTFHLAGINNQNFLMRDDQTGTFWQQITGRGISGPLAGTQLELVPSSELSFALWKTQTGRKTVLKPVAKYARDYAEKDWDVHMAKVKTVLDFPGSGMKPRDLILGVNAFGVSRAYPLPRIQSARLIEDRLNGTAVLIVLGPDGKSIRAFERAPDAANRENDYFSVVQKPSVAMNTPLFMDSATGSTWNFDGCAVAGSARGICLKPVAATEDYWFDWRNYHPQTTVFRR